MIRWPITEDTARTYEQSDTTAKNLYKKLYDRYKAQKNQELNVDCLGIARYIFCAYANPTCIPANKTSGSVGSNQGKGVCKWLCDLWMVRCPSEFELYGTVCSRIEESNCSNGVRLVVLMFVLLLILWNKIVIVGSEIRGLWSNWSCLIGQHRVCHIFLHYFCFTSIFHSLHF